jgi:hypothetical protein
MIMSEYIIHPIPNEIFGVRLVTGDFIREGDFIADPSSGEWKKAPRHLIGEKIRKGSKMLWVRPAEVYKHPTPPAIYGTRLIPGDIIQEGDLFSGSDGNWEKVQPCFFGTMLTPLHSKRWVRPDKKKNEAPLTQKDPLSGFEKIIGEVSLYEEHCKHQGS